MGEMFIVLKEEHFSYLTRISSTRYVAQCDVVMLLKTLLEKHKLNDLKQSSSQADEFECKETLWFYQKEGDFPCCLEMGWLQI